MRGQVEARLRVMIGTEYRTSTLESWRLREADIRDCIAALLDYRELPPSLDPWDVLRGRRAAGDVVLWIRSSRRRLDAREFRGLLAHLVEYLDWLQTDEGADYESLPSWLRRNFQPWA